VNKVKTKKEVKPNKFKRLQGFLYFVFFFGYFDPVLDVVQKSTGAG
jgi:hypothetical protein